MRRGARAGLACLLAASGALAACRDGARPLTVPPVTSARPDPGTPVFSGAATAPREMGPPSAEAGAPIAVPQARFVEAPGTLEEGLCQTVLFAVAKGKMTVMGEALAAGDVLVVKHAEASVVKGAGLAVEVRTPEAPCAVRDRPAPQKKVIRGNAAQALTFAGGKMTAHLDVREEEMVPGLYLGRLSGTATVPEHVHEGSFEILAAIDAAGTLTIDGRDVHLAPRQVVVFQPGAPHAWKPDPGTKLVAIQMYTPAGPEARFVDLAAAEKDAGSDAAIRPSAVAR
jgi:mannose-6-phosphate isomerase-like protein (cupin superfamily)